MMIIDAKIIKTLVHAEGITTVYENGLMDCAIKEDAFLDVPYLLEGKRQLEELGKGRKYYIISESVGFFRISQAARELCASREYSSHMAAVAVVTNHVSTRLVFDLYYKINKPQVPTRAFTHREQALAWLTQRMERDGVFSLNAGAV